LATHTVLVLNGPNLNLLGVREPHLYGSETLAEIEEACLERAASLDLDIDFRQSNTEGQLIDWVQEARQTADAILVNAGGLSHTSIALMDALLASDLPVIEVHLTNIYRREPYRHNSYISQAARGVVCGLGGHGYELALEAIARLLQAEA
jgi:3-dehydroquinate dehydratase-2